MFSVGVLVDGQRVDHPHGIAFAEPLQLADDLAVEVWSFETQHKKLNWTNRHDEAP